MFGYGSLIAPKGLDGRGFSKTYRRSADKPGFFEQVLLQGYSRCTTNFGSKTGEYWSIYPNDLGSTWGMLFPIDQPNYRKIKMNEGAWFTKSKRKRYFRGYLMHEVSDCIELSKNLTHRDLVFTVVYPFTHPQMNPDPMPLNRVYYNNCLSYAHSMEAMGIYHEMKNYEKNHFS